MEHKDEALGCWWCLHVDKKQVAGDVKVNGVPICWGHTGEVVRYQVEDTGGADVRPLGWVSPKTEGPPMF